MSRQLAEAIADRAGRPLRMVPCRIVQVTPLRVSFDGGASSVPAAKVAGLTYATSTANNAVALVQSPAVPLVLPIGA